jgi:dTDP-4-amino-4,6-dideoxygalactose transaminase
MESYLALHHQVDICLDTFPYGGSTTTCHAMWMGVPTLTLPGGTVSSRVGACNLSHLGLGEFIAEDKVDFVEKGLLWANNLIVLSSLRSELRGRFEQSEMSQPVKIAAGLERALRVMWRGWCAGQSAESFEIKRQDVDIIVQGEELKLAESKQQILPIYVTQPLLPPLEDFIPYLQQIWDSKQLTNGGPFHQQLEQELCEYLGVKHISLFSNGTLALMTAMQALRITGEVITTPYSFVATAHSLLWNGIKPVFVDIDPVTLNLDPRKIEAAITPQTTAIMPVHCYGHPCDVKGIQKIADNYGLKVIYDAAHAFGVQCPDGSILNHGDLSVLSFHATKVFNTFEGGAIVCHDAKTKQRIDHLKNFGFVDEVTVVAAGINGKMSEVNAAFGLLQLKSIHQALQSRKIVDARYRALLTEVRGIRCLSESGEKTANYAYFPILVESDYPLGRNDLYQKLRDKGVYARRYFYPLVSDFPMYRGMQSAAHDNLPVANKVAEQVICLPIYPDLSNEQIEFIARLVGE